jgi:thiamine pyrophosphate-dependent acetolactate synthase large subunit-like protein
MGLSARRLSDPQEVSAALKESMKLGQPSLLDIRVADGFGS